ncbi:MAG: WG repeat-containing protein [Clostridia bacterium]|nr:WG repeat-containing protein [Clostridia bacterium]
MQAIISKENIINMYNNKMVQQVSIKNGVLYTYDNYIKLLSNTEMKYLNNDGNLINNKEIFTQNSVFSYNKNGKWGFVNKEDNIIVEAKYDMVTEFNNYGYAGICINDKWGVVNENGEIIQEPSYKIDWNEPEFIGKYCKLNFGYGFEYYTDELTK